MLLIWMSKSFFSGDFRGGALAPSAPSCVRLWCVTAAANKLEFSVDANHKVELNTEFYNFSWLESFRHLCYHHYTVTNISSYYHHQQQQQHHHDRNRHHYCIIDNTISYENYILIVCWAGDTIISCVCYLA